MDGLRRTMHKEGSTRRVTACGWLALSHGAHGYLGSHSTTSVSIGQPQRKKTAQSPKPSPSAQQVSWRPHLFQSFVVDEAGSILGDLKLPLLDRLAELPIGRGQSTVLQAHPQ